VTRSRLGNDDAGSVRHQNLIVQGANLNSYVQQVVSGGFLLAVVILQATLARRSGASEAT
jgi:ribose/xylose/arabinose/galactoside ABC-type transport system permease subunit